MICHSKSQVDVLNRGAHARQTQAPAAENVDTSHHKYTANPTTNTLQIQLQIYKYKDTNTNTHALQREHATQTHLTAKYDTNTPNTIQIHYKSNTNPSTTISISLQLSPTLTHFTRNNYLEHVSPDCNNNSPTLFALAMFNGNIPERIQGNIIMFVRDCTKIIYE